MEQHDKAKFDAADKDHDGTLDRQEAKVFPRISKNFDQIDDGQGRHRLSGRDQGLR